MRELYLCLLPCLCLLLICCKEQREANQSKEEKQQRTLSTNIQANNTTQIAAYLVEIFEDSKGNLWFGTIAKGVARYTPSIIPKGGKLKYFSKKDGLAGNAVVSIAEDKAGNIWFGTHAGLSKYDGKTFTNFTKKHGLCHNRVSNILIDKEETLWVGTWGGVCRFDGTTFTDFPIPIPDIELLPYQTTMDWITEIMEDKAGNIWFGRDGYGACKYDGESFTHFTKKDGLLSNNIQVIQEDSEGNIWFGTRAAERDHPEADKRFGKGGLNRYDGKMITQYPDLEGFNKNDIYAIYEDKTANIWIGANGVGIYRYDGNSFQLYKETNRMDLTTRFGVQSILEDSNGTFWFGFSGGLFRLEDSSIINVSQEDLN